MTINAPAHERWGRRGAEGCQIACCVVLCRADVLLLLARLPLIYHLLIKHHFLSPLLPSLSPLLHSSSSLLLLLLLATVLLAVLADSLVPYDSLVSTQLLSSTPTPRLRSSYLVSLSKSTTSPHHHSISPTSTSSSPLLPTYT